MIAGTMLRARSPHALLALALAACSEPAAPAPPRPPAPPPIAEPAEVSPAIRAPTPRPGELRPRGGLAIARDAIRPRIAVGATGSIIAWARRDCEQSEQHVVLPWTLLDGEAPALSAAPCAPTSVSFVLAPRDPAAVVCTDENRCEVRGLGDVSGIAAARPPPEPETTPIAIDDQRRLVRRYRTGIDVPIEGVGAPVAALASTTGQRGPLAIWVEGDPPAHRVRVAWLSMLWTELVSSADLDVGDAVVGDVAIDAREGHVAIALTQRDGDSWVVRTAALTPP